MNRKSKKGNSRSTSTIDLGRDRKEKIDLFRAKMQLKGVKISTIDVAVNMLVDKALELELTA